MERYRILKDGEILQIGDEYYSQGQWVRLNEAEYKEWISYATAYQAAEMCKFRRLISPNQLDVSLSREILNERIGEAGEYLNYDNI